jgi:large subunit ribosomal protein L23
VFKVTTDATKPEIKQAVELLFNVKVDAVQVANMKGKSKRFGQKIGRRNDWKKAYISLQAGQEIDLLGGAE